jgi:hypothetical protein
MNANGDRYFSAEVYRLAAVRCSASNERASALTQLHTAIAVAQSHGAKLFELRAALDLADLQPDEGRPAIAAALTDFPEPEPWPEIVRAGQLAGSW